MDTYKEELYGKILWECYRAKFYIVAVSLLYVALCTAAILYAIEERGIYIVGAVIFLLIAIWQINRVHWPVALVCEKQLLVSIPWSLFYSDYGTMFRQHFMPVDYNEIAGVSSGWNQLYIGARIAGGIVALPVQLAYISTSDKADFKEWIERKQAGRTM